MLSCRIVMLRRCSGMNQSQLAQQLHISPSAMGMYEQGRRTPSIEILVQLARIFDVSLDFLITGSEHRTQTDQKKQNDEVCLCRCSRCNLHK